MSQTISSREIENLERNCARYPEAAALREKLVAAPDNRLLEATDEWLIDFVPDPRVKRSLSLHEGDISYGCPIHRGGRYVFTQGADPFEPYRVTCSIGDEPYPNEEFLESSAPDAPWDEQGWLDTRKTVDGQKNPTYGLRYYFHAHYAYWGRWMKLGPFMNQLAVSHFLAGDGHPDKTRAAHAAAVLLIRLANVFPHLERDDFRSAAWVKDFPFVVGIMDYIWEPGHTDQYATAYDLIKDAILADESLLRLDYDRSGTAWGDNPSHDYDGDGKVSTADLLACIERDLLRAYGEIYTAIAPKYANATIVHQKALSLLAVVLNEPKYYEHARSVLLEHLATNWYTNDGAYYEGSIPGYGHFGLRTLRDASEWLRRFDPDLVSSRIVKGFLFEPSMVCLDRTLPNNDDAGGVQLDKLGRQLGFDMGDYQNAYLTYGDDRLLRPIALAGGASQDPKFAQYEDLFADYSEENVSVLQDALANFSVKRLPSTVSRAGYGVLRGGSDATPFDLFVTFDSFGGSHTHYDTFNPILYGFDYVLVPDLGYPPALRSPSRGDWINHPLSHWTVTVNRQSMRHDFERGQLKMLVDRPGFRAFSGSSPSSYGETASRYDRTLCLIDKPDGTAIVVDFFRVRGGKEHLYSFHGAADDGIARVQVDGATLDGASPFETLQGMWHGKPVPYAQPPEGSGDPCLAYLVDPRPVHIREDADALRVSFPRGDDEGTQLDFWMPAACAEAFVLAEGRREAAGGRGSARLPYLIARSGDMENETEAESSFCAVLESHQGQADVTDVRFDSEAGRLEIAFRDGSAWTVTAGTENVAFKATQPEGATRSVTASLTEMGKVAEMDESSHSFKLESARDLAEGDLLIIENDLDRNAFYQAETVQPDGRVTVGDRWTDLRVAKGYLTGKSEGARVYYDGDYVIQHPIRAHCRGARIFNEAGQSCRVVAVEDEAIVLDAPPEACAKFSVDADGDGRMAFHICDFGNGDAIKRIEVSDSAAE